MYQQNSTGLDKPEAETPKLGADERWEEVLPPEGHPQLGKEILRVVGEIIGDKINLGLHEKWLRAYKLARGVHWDKPAKVPLKKANLIYTHIQRTANTLTDNNPTFNVNQAGNAEDKDAYTKLQLTAEFWWNETEQQQFFENSVRQGETYGITVEKCIFNPDIEHGIGDVETIIVDPYHFGLYPVKCNGVQKAEIVLHFYPMPVREARRRWPDFKDKIRGDVQYLEDIGSERRELVAGEREGDKGLLATIQGVVKNLVSKAGSTQGDSEGEEETLVVEAWCKDYTTGEDGLPKYRGFIRRITACSAGLLVVDDRSNPSISEALPDEKARLSYLYDKFPFASANSVSEANNFWGSSDIDQLDNLQAEVNKTISQLSYHKDRAVRPKIVNPKDTGVPNEHFTNITGIINPSSSLSAQGIRYLEANNNLRDMLEVFNLYKELFLMVGGTFDLDQAQTQGRNVIAYKAIAALIERAATMMRGKIRNYSKLIRERGRMFLSLMMNYYTEDRWITYDDSGESHSMPIKGTDLIVPSKLTVISGSTMPISKVQQREEALELFDKGAIDQEDLLDKIEWDSRAAVIQRMKEGPLFDFIERLEMMGTPPEMVGLLREFAGMDREDFEKGIEAGEIPMVAIPEADPSATLAIQEKQTEIEKVQADIAHIYAQIENMKAEQQVRLAGIEYDRQKMEVERVKALAGIRNTEQIDSQRAKSQPAPGPERGLKTNNQ